MAAAAMTSLSPLSTTTIEAVGSIPPPPPSTTTFVDEDRHHRRRHRLPPHSTMTAIAAVNDDGAVNDDDGRCRLHHNGKSPYAYGDQDQFPYAYGDCLYVIPVCILGSRCNPRMHTGIGWTLIPICIQGFVHPCMHTGIFQSPVITKLCGKLSLVSPYV